MLATFQEIIDHTRDRLSWQRHAQKQCQGNTDNWLAQYNIGCIEQRNGLWLHISKGITSIKRNVPKHEIQTNLKNRLPCIQMYRCTEFL